MRCLAIVFACSVLCGTARADGVLWGQYNGILVFYPLSACTAVPTGTRGICFDSPSGTLMAVDDTGALTPLEGGGAGGHVIEDEGTPLTARANLNFAGAGVVCTDSAPDTLCTIAGGGGAPTTAQYWVATADAGLSAERDLGLLTTGLVLNTVTATVGVPSTYAGHSCAASNWLRVLDASGAGTCSQPLFSDISGSVTDGQVPNTITIDLSAAATALAANPADCGVATEFAVGILASGVATCEAIADADVPNTITVDLSTAATALAANPANCADATHFSTGVTAAGVADCEAIADADVPNTITVDLATLATTATTANAGDSATAFFPGGVLEGALLPDPGATTNGGVEAETCSGTDKISAINTDGTVTCSADAGGAGGGNSSTTTQAVTSDGMYYTKTVTAAWVASGSAIICKPYGGGGSTPTAESIAVSGIEAITATIVAGVSFDLMIRNPYGLEGTVEFRCIGV